MWDVPTFAHCVPSHAVLAIRKKITCVNGEKMRLQVALLSSIYWAFVGVHTVKCNKIERLELVKFTKRPFYAAFVVNIY